MKRLPDDVKRDACNRVRAGESPKKIAQKLGVTRQAVELWVKKYATGNTPAGWGGGGAVSSKPQDTGNVQAAQAVAPTPVGLDPLPSVTGGAFKPREIDLSALPDDGPTEEDRQREQKSELADLALEEKALTSVRNMKRMLIGGAGELFFGDSSAPEIQHAAGLSWPLEEAVKSNAPMIANAVGDTFAGPWGFAIAALLDVGITSWTMWKIWKEREALELKKLEAAKQSPRRSPSAPPPQRPPENPNSEPENSPSIPEADTLQSEAESIVSPSPEYPAAANPHGLAKLRIGGELITPAP